MRLNCLDLECSFSGVNAKSPILKYFRQGNDVDLSEEELGNLRRQLLKIMQADVANRLASSLHELVKVDIQREEQRHQVGRPKVELVAADDEPPPPSISPIRRVLDVFRGSQAPEPVSPAQQTYSIFKRPDIGERLLILGEPGAGKTTELLMVAKKLIEEAIADTDKPIPIIFELSSWTSEDSIIDWLGEQLNQKYGISAKLSGKLAKQWVEQNALLPLLDDLDQYSGQN